MKKVLVCFIVFAFIKNVALDRLDDRFRLLYSDTVKCQFDRSLNLDVCDTKVYFYDFKNSLEVSCTIDTALDCITEVTNLDTNRSLTLFVPGYKSNIKQDVEELIRQTYKKVPDVYLIIIDHSAYTYESEAETEAEKLKNFERSVLYSYYIGKAIGKLLVGLNRSGFPSRNIHGIGHSLGAHIVGYAGDNYLNQTSETIWKITGLDPAGPCFVSADKKEQLRAGNAKYVEIYHCNAGQLGTTNVIGDIDFFFNKEGKIQPVCWKGLIDESLATCNHKTCVIYWTNTVLNHDLYTAVECSSYKMFSEGSCVGRNETAAGYSNPGTAKGTFFVTTQPDQ